MVERIPQHHHCKNCGRAFTGQGRFCCEECETTTNSEVSSKKRQLIMLWLLSMVILIIALVVGL